MNRKIRMINTRNSPNPMGPYSQAINTGEFIFISGQIPIIPNTMIIPDSVYKQTYQSLQNIRNIVESQQLNVSNIVKTTLFIKNIKDLSEINISYENFFSIYFNNNNNNKVIFPARSCVEVSRLPKDVLIEIDAIAMRDI